MRASPLVSTAHALGSTGLLKEPLPLLQVPGTISWSRGALGSGLCRRAGSSMNCGMGLLLTHKEFGICQEFFSVLLASFFSLSVASGPFVSCPWVLRIYSLGVFVTTDSYLIAVPLGSVEGGSGGSPVTCIFHAEKSDGEQETGLLGWVVGFRVLALGTWGFLNPLRLLSPVLRCLIFPKATSEFFDEIKRTQICCQKFSGGEVWLLLPNNWETNFSSRMNQVILIYLRA